jgi:hypothetical protein
MNITNILPLGQTHLPPHSVLSFYQPVMASAFLFLCLRSSTLFLFLSLLICELIEKNISSFQVTTQSVGWSVLCFQTIKHLDFSKESKCKLKEKLVNEKKRIFFTKKTNEWPKHSKVTSIAS